MAPIEYYATGRRKTSTARVFLRPGTGNITVNHREFTNFFPTEAQRVNVRRPLQLTEMTDKFDILDLTTNSWQIGQLPFFMKESSVIAVNNVIYIAGGYLNGSLSTQVMKLEW